jgi:ABC-type antimicrobial peptide transport system permease subunit
MYSLVNYSISQRRKEIGIRMAIGARPADIWWLISIELLSILGLGSLTGFVLGAIAGRCVQGVLYHVKITDPNVLAIPSLTVLVLAAVAATPALIRAIRIDPAMTLRTD